MNRAASCFVKRFHQKEKPRKSFRLKFNILSFLLVILILSLIYQICTGLYGLFLYNYRLKKEKLILQEKVNLMESLEARTRENDLAKSLRQQTNNNKLSDPDNQVKREEVSFKD